MRDVENLFMEEVTRSSYTRALLDDFSVVDLVAKENASSVEDNDE